MNAVLLVAPRSWRSCKTEIKDSIEFFTLLTDAPFRVSIVGGANVERVRIKDAQALNDEQRHTLLSAVDKLNEKAEANPQDPRSGVIEWRNELAEISTRFDKLAFQKYLSNKILAYPR